MMRVGLVTSREVPHLAADDALLLPALAGHGLDAVPVVWDDPAVAWSSFRLCVIRSTWDYHLRRDAFLAWLAHVADRTALWNPPPVVRWNSHKRYLADLAARGLPTVPTVWLPAGRPADLAALITAQGWDRAVIKPAVSASAYATILVDPADQAAGQAHLDRWLATRDMMVQPFLPSVGTSGERSLFFIDGRCTHAVRRAPVLGPAQQHGSLDIAVAPAADEQSLATAVLAAVAAPLLYARVDLVRDEAGAMRLLELELIEPSLYLHACPAAVDRLAVAIAERCRAPQAGGIAQGPSSG